MRSYGVRVCYDRQRQQEITQSPASAMAAMPETRAELNAVIEEQVQFLLGPPQIAGIGKLVEHFGKSDDLGDELHPGQERA